MSYTKGDYISRQAAIDAVNELTKWYYETYHEKRPTAIAVIDKLMDLPSAQPEPQWIPCGERLPEDDTLMLVNFIDQREDAMDIWIGWHEMENVWYIDGRAHSKEYGNEVIAWMPLPEPYKKRRRKNHDKCMPLRLREQN